jgi:hypothetical protein
MIPLFKRILFAMLWDEDMATRWLIAFLGTVAVLLTNAGNFPGTNWVIPVARFQWAGPFFGIAALVLTSITTSLKKQPPPTP